MTELQLTCLGKFELSLAGEPLVKLRFAKARALICYLAVEGRPHSRAALAGLLWSELPEDDARANLRVMLTKLRHTFPEHVLIERETVTFNRKASYTLDVEAFLSHFYEHAELRNLVGLRDAAALYRGDFLDGFNVSGAPLFDEWATGQRERLRHLALQALHTLATYYTQQRDYPSSIDYLTRLLTLDPWREDAHRQLMELLALSGQPEAALAQFETCRRILDAALGVEPSPETLALARSVENGEIKPQLPLTTHYNVPKPLTPILGRDALLTRLTRQLREPGTRLLTLTGTGGVGKTRLGLELAGTLQADFADGVFFVPLASVSGSALVGTAIAQSLGLRESGKEPLEQQLVTYLQSRQILLLLDNFEHLLPAAGLVAELLAYAPQLKVLTTSRAPLHLRGEQEAAVVPLSFPDVHQVDRSSGDVAALASYPSMALFCERARALTADFVLTNGNSRAIAQICARLDGLPLAIELAAARSKLLSPQVLATRLDHRLQLLTHGAADLPKRHQTLRETLAWSYDLLSAAEQRLFRRLGVVAGGCNLSLAVALGDNEQAEVEVLELLTSLLDNSLLQRVAAAASKPRVRMLETIREYALEKLAEAPQEQARALRNHAQYFLALAEGATSNLLGPEKKRWLAVLAEEHNNLRAALTWAEVQRENEVGLRLVAALGRFWLVQGHVVEGYNWSARLLAAAEVGTDHTRARADVRAAALRAAAWLAHADDDFQQATIWFAESATLVSPYSQLGQLTTPLVNEAMQARAVGDYQRATSLLEESLAQHRAEGNHQSIAQDGIGLSLARLGLVLTEQGRYARATELYDECLRLHQTLNDREGVAATLLGLSDVARDRGNLVRLRELCAACLRVFRDLGEQWGIGFALNNLALAACTEGALPRAAELAAESLSVLGALQSAAPSAEVLSTVASIASAQGERQHASEAFAKSLALTQARGPKWLVAVNLEGIAELFLEDQPGQAAELLGAAAALRTALGTPLPPFRQARQAGVYERGRTLLGEHAWQQAFYAGSQQQPEQAVELALARVRTFAEFQTPIKEAKQEKGKSDAS